MNKIICKIGAAVVTITVFLFAICLIADLPFVSYLVCMFLPLGYIMMAVGFQYESCEERKVSASVGVVIAVIYAVMVLLVYYAQTTSVQLGGLNEQAVRILDFQRGGLLFNYDLLGYGMMALSTLFIGLSITPSSKADKWLKYLMILHGVFFIGCFIMPMTGVFTSMERGETGNGGTIALLCWCVYFLPIGVFAYKHFQKAQ